MLQDIERVLLSEEQLQQRVRELGEEISKEYAGKEILMIGVLRGAVMFMADLARAIAVPVMIDFMAERCQRLIGKLLGEEPVAEAEEED